MPLFDDPRSAWTTYVPSGRARIAPSSRKGVTWHWAGGPVRLFGKSHAACLSQVRAWEAFHRDTRGWNSIGYNALICVHARVIEGRGFDYRGAHAGPTGNDPTYGIQFMVGQGEHVTPAMHDRAYHLERALWEHSGRRLDSFGHRDFMQTDCPGDEEYRWAHSTHTLSGTPTPAPTGGLTMADIDDILAKLDALPQRILDATLIDREEPKNDSTLAQVMRSTWTAVASTRDGVAVLAAKGIDYDALAAAVVAKMPAVGAPSVADLSAALRNVLGSLDAAEG